MIKTDNRPPFFNIGGQNYNDMFSELETPCYVIDENQLIKNGEILKSVADRTGCKILLAQKAFSNFNLYPVISKYLAGTEASGLFEARLGKEEMPEGEVHVFCAAYREDEIEPLLKYADHIIFNSINQLKRYGKKIKSAGKEVGLRINPQCSTQEGHEIYDPCADGSRLGVTRAMWDSEMTDEVFALLDGLHFHTLCEQNSDDLKKTVAAVDEKFGFALKQMKWVNMGGGHHITRIDYDIDTLCECIRFAQNNWCNTVYLEPGEAVALNAGYTVTRVLDTVRNGNTEIAILDASAACHMPDVIEMPYTPPLYNAFEKEDKTHKFKYRLAGPTCLAGDVIGDYFFDTPLNTGDLLLFGDMAIYTTCKNNTFNGMPLPQIYELTQNGEFLKLTDFGYTDFKSRLGVGHPGRVPRQVNVYRNSD